MNRIVGLVVAAVGLVFLVGLGYVGYQEHAHETGWSLGPAHASAPVQPILYSHKIHVAERGISCTYCHQFADKADFAGIPPMDTCLACHKGLDTSRVEDTSMTKAAKRAEIAKFLERSPAQAELLGEPAAVSLKEPESFFRWRRVYDLPDHVKFPHKIHVWALRDKPETDAQLKHLNAKVKDLPDARTAAVCMNCHGDMFDMQTARQDVDLIKMGTCLTCHHKMKAGTDCWNCHF